jgi:hypothetical protein
MISSIPALSQAQDSFGRNYAAEALLTVQALLAVDMATEKCGQRWREDWRQLGIT